MKATTDNKRKNKRRKFGAPTTYSGASYRRALLTQWVGSWVFNPKTELDKKAAKLVRAATKFTPRGSFISPVAVAAIDVLGMTNLLEEKSLEDIAVTVAEPFYGSGDTLAGLRGTPITSRQFERLGFRREAGIHAVRISDTILLTRRPDWECGDPHIAEAEAVISLAAYVCKVTKLCSVYDVKLRSAISFGNCLMSVGDSAALLGKPTGEASKYERCQEWMGGMLAPSAIEALRRGAMEAKEINGPDFVVQYPNFLVEFQIPLKESAAKLGQPQIALNWITGTLPGALMLKAKVPEIPSSSAVASSIRQKCINTARFADHCATAPFHTVI